MSDPEGILATPITIIERKNDKKAVEAILQIVEMERVGRIIVGLPVSLSGSTGEQAQKVKAFADLLAKIAGCPVEMRDERFSTVTARNLMRESRTKKSPKRREHEKHDDAFAAAVILQEYLDEVRQKLPENL